MIGSILGDYLGSKFEKIPGKELRKVCSITDDSWLSFAQLDWLNQIDIVKFSHLHKQNKNFPNKEYTRFSEEIFKSAKKYLVKWVDVGMQNLSGDLLPGFSPGMVAWSENEKGISKNYIKRKTTTNGSIMRNSPLAWYADKIGLSLEESISLGEIFAKTTHDSDESIKAVRLHTTLSYLVYKKIINSLNIKQALISDDYSFKSASEPILFSDLYIKPLKYWLEEKKTKKFIWDAKTSLDIAASAIYFSGSYDEFINFCCATEMDTDTYAAIGGDIAFQLFGKDIPINFKEHILSFHDVKQLCHLNKIYF